MIFMLLILFNCGCNNDKEAIPCPVTSVELPQSSSDKPAEPGQILVIRGNGFAPDCEIWLHATEVAKTSEAIQGEITEVTDSSLSFIAPEVTGRQSVELRQDGGTWILGELIFPDKENLPLEILPRRISHIRVTWPEDMTFVIRYTYDAEGRIVVIRETDRQQLSGSGATETDRQTTVTYSSDRIVETDYTSAVSTYELTDGRATAVIGQPAPGGVYSDDYTFSYDDAGYISGSTWVETPDHTYSAECLYTVVNGSLIRVDAKENSEEWYRGTRTYENDPARLNNLNIDLFGISEFLSEGDFDRIYLFGVGGNRLRTLPLRIDYGEDGAETYRYEMEGDYISQIEISDEDGELNTRLEIFYE